MRRTHLLLRQQQARAEALQRQLEALQQDLAAAISEDQDACVALATSECNQLCNRIMTQLPRELRDMIYQCISTNSEERISREYFRSIMNPKTRTHDYDSKRWKATHYPEHYWDVEYVGEDFSRELLENYYRTSTFLFGDDDGLIERFLNVDQMKIGYAPKELVSRIEVHLNAMTYDRTTCIGYMFGCATKPERLQAALRGVQCLKPGASVVVHFTTQAKYGEQKEEQMKVACTALGPVLEEARTARLDVRLVMDKKTEVDLDSISCGHETEGSAAAETLGENSSG
jgi:hypothetical protein